MKNELFKGEEIKMSSEDGSIVLTNQRVRQVESAHFVSIMLDKISAIKFVYRSNVYALIFGVLLTVGGLITGLNDEGDAMAFGLLTGIVFLVYYFFTRRHVVAIVSDSGTSIDFHTKGVRRDSVLKFVNAVEQQRIDFLKKMHTFDAKL